MNEDDAITRGTVNVFADLGCLDAEERQTKLRLAHAPNGLMVQRGLTKAAAAEKLKVNQPEVYALANYKLGRFPVLQLMSFLRAVGENAETAAQLKQLRPPL